MKLQVFGTGCAACSALEANVRAAAAELAPDCEVEVVHQILEMVRLGVTQIPALAIDGEVRSMGRALTVIEIKELLRGAARRG